MRICVERAIWLLVQRRRRHDIHSKCCNAMVTENLLPGDDRMAAELLIIYQVIADCIGPCLMHEANVASNLGHCLASVTTPS